MNNKKKENIAFYGHGKWAINTLKILITSYIILAIIDWRIAVFLISIPTFIKIAAMHAIGIIETKGFNPSKIVSKVIP